MTRSTRLHLFIVLAASVLLVSCAAPAKGQAPATPTVQDEATELEGVIWASGDVVPVRWAHLSFETGGRVAEVSVEEGDQVQAGQVLARLHAPDLEQAVRGAEASLASAQAELARVQAGPRPQELAAAEAAAHMADAGVARAQAALERAQAELRRLKAGAKPEELTAAQARMEQAAAAVRQAQAAYDRVAGQPDVAARPEALALEQATQEYVIARAQYEALARGATAEEIAIAEAQVKAAQADLKAAQAAAAEAYARLELLRAGARPEDVAVAQAAVAQAEAALERARVALHQALLIAPYDGTIGTVWVREGETVIPGQPAMTIGDLSTLRVEVTDLRETDVARVREGQEVEVTFDALPNETFRGIITRISPMAREEKGSSNYTAVVTLDRVDPRLRWGMTAFVNIKP
ncbi:MAG: efflux RND transporter periplasmic adaptor subunit [Anaerolineae bacterium]|nr:efflux RND transporter periplasmic adaptor subunit [Anaerolineae bacterium]MDW8100185.1 efflux RND transporter periplasmic adaptor subunit [Anaerolineae bacterium]